MRALALSISSVLLAGCSCGAPPGGRGRDGGGDPTTDTGTIEAADAPRPDSAGSPEICDGVDNDGNGIVDDVDAGGDGVCDCLRIATIGVAGSAGVSGVFDAWLDSRSTRGATHLGDAELTPALLAQHQIVLSQDIRGRTRTASEVAALEGWIRAGGGFMTLIGYGDTSERANVNLLLAPTGIQYGPEAILYGGGFTLPVNGWHVHPLSERVTRLGIDNGYPVVGAGALVADEGGWDVLRAVELGAGHVVVWGDEWISFDSEWTGHPDYQVERFWLNVLKWLSPPGECQVPILI
jgi:hypothetical protein